MTTLRAALDAFLKADRSSHTQRSYEHTLGKMTSAIGPERDLRLITLVDLLAYCEHLQQGRAHSTYAQYVQIIRLFFSWCVRAGLIEISPATEVRVRAIPPEPGAEKAIPPDAIEATLRHAWPNARNYAILMFLKETGCRLGACARLTLDNLNLQNMTAKVIEKGSIPERVYFGPDAVAALMRWLEVRPEVRHNCVWTSKLSPYKPLGVNGIRHMVYALTQAATDKRYNPHSFRHATAVSFAESGAPAHVTQRKLNHKAFPTTWRNYYPNAHADQVAAWTKKLSGTQSSIEDNPKIVSFSKITKKQKGDV